MKGDFTRFTFNSKNHYSRVMMQQGRVQLDADWNEQLDISAYRTETEITDFIGQSGAPESPKDGAGVSTSFRIGVDQGKVLIGEGRYYVEGMLFENDQRVSFNEQPDYPGATLPTKPGEYLAYLDVWQHHLTALEVPAIREAALGGADTTTRVQNVWQVKLHLLKDEERQKLDDPVWQPNWELPISSGGLTVEVKQPGAIVENQLYRVEIHQGNASETDRNNKVTFKWSRDNGAIAAQVEAIDNDSITIKNAGRDPQLAFPVNQLVEFTDATRTLNGQPGIHATVKTVQGNQLTVEWKTSDRPSKDSKDPIIVRRWDCTDAIAIDRSKAHELEQSITVQFEPSKLYKTGDYWLIPSRALTGSIELPSATEPQSPHGTRHRYCRLALLKLDGNQFSVLTDYRSIFKPITSGLLSKAGDTMKGDLTIDRNLYVTGNVGIGTKTPQNLLSVAGGVTIGARYVNLTASPNGLLVEGNVGIGTVEPSSQLSVTQGVAIGPDYAIYSNASSGNLLVQGNAGIGTTDPKSMLSVAGGVAIGSDYASSNASPTDGLIIKGNVGIGTTSPVAKLHVNGDFIIEKGQLIRGFPVIAFAKQNVSFSVSRGSGRGNQFEFTLPDDVVNAEALIQSWQLDTQNISAEQIISQIAIQANVVKIDRNKVSVFISYSLSFDGGNVSINQTGLKADVLVIATMNKTY
jgi:Family of unknown function (DUF6519)